MKTALSTVLLSVAAVLAAHAQSEGRPRRALPFFGMFDPSGALRTPQASATAGEARGTSAEFDVVMSTCGARNDWQDVELYAGPRPTTRFVDDRQAAVAQIQWRTDIAALLAGRDMLEGNVAGQRWCTGTLIAADQLLTAAHCFEPHNDAQGWQSPRHRQRATDGSANPLAPRELAALMQINFRFKVNGNDPRRGVRPSEVYPVLLSSASTCSQSPSPTPSSRSARMAAADCRARALR